ncbi:plectin-like [Numida meleagris]|uniref:plectin-like n=1 Tax=Numida meleagris TaxID=8996 RepID=UPI000B3DA4D5|nr:plectin-like [Numida meleagris]
MPAEELQRALRSLETRYQQFVQHGAQARCFDDDDRAQLQRDYGACTQQYQLLLQAQEKGEQEESLRRSCISQLKDIRLQLESCESRTVHKLRLPLDKEPAAECKQRMAEQEVGAGCSARP